MKFKSIITLLLVFALVFSLTACFSKTEDETTEATTEDYIETETETFVGSDAYTKVKAELMQTLESDKGDSSLEIYECDLNGDGYNDVVYYYGYRDPAVAIYSDGEFKTTVIESEVKEGSMFPSGPNSGLFIDSEKGVIIYRYGGHTQGTALCHGAEAFSVVGDSLTSVWVIRSDADKYSEKYPGAADADKAEEECLAEFETLYTDKTSDYNLINFFDVCVTE